MSSFAPCAFPAKDRYQKILTDALFQKELEQIRHLEEQRIYCGHDLNHLLDVARITYIQALELLSSEEMAAPAPALNRLKDIIYAAALLHDIGRAREYEEQIPHDEASAKIAGEILTRCGYLSREIQQITALILSHRGQDETEEGSAEDLPPSQLLSTQKLITLFREADKASRLCFCCRAKDSCKWDEARKNPTVYR